MRRRIPPDQTHKKADENAMLAVKDTLEIVGGTPDPVSVKRKRAVEILRKLYLERRTDLDRAFPYEDAELLLFKK